MNFLPCDISARDCCSCEYWNEVTGECVYDDQGNSMRTLEEKLRYNSIRKTDFSFGYKLGVSIYKDYPKLNEKGKQEIKCLIDDYKDLARGGDKISKGFMCGIRDAANERKRKKK